jgi:hypothetical protein
MNHFESSVINLIWTKKLVLLYCEFRKGVKYYCKIGLKMNLHWRTVVAKTFETATVAVLGQGSLV